MLKKSLVVAGSTLAMAAAVVAMPEQAGATSGVWAGSGPEIGTVTITWSDRGGNCAVAYTEAAHAGYQYNTTTSCDNVHLNISQLVPGSKYKFIVSANGTPWSAPVYAVATGAAPAPVVVAQASRPVAAQTVAYDQTRVWAETGLRSGEVNLGWDYRNATCIVKYKETNSGAGYQYETNTHCDGVGMTISQLRPGVSYTFMVRRNGGTWSRPVAALAAGSLVPVVTTSSAPVTTAQAAGVWAAPGVEMGSITVGWALRGSTCIIKYTEYGSSVMHYETNTHCDGGSLNISQLVSGQKYAFSVRQNGGAWSSPVAAVAR